MATELFHDLYKRALKLDCAILHILRGLDQGLGPAPLTSRVSLAEGLHDIGADFLDAMDDFARKHHVRQSPVKYICPTCGSPYCNGAVPMVRTHVVVVQPGGPPPKSGK